MNFLIAATVLHLASCGIINQDHEVEHNERATSYQNVHIEHFHPVPTFIKKEYSKLLEHPVAKGTSSSRVEIHHGGKYDHGYAFTKSENNIQQHGFEDLGGLAGVEEAGQGNYQVHDLEQEYLQYQGQGEQGANLAPYQLSGGQGYPGGETGYVQYENHDV